MTSWYRDWQDEFTPNRRSKVNTHYSLIGWNTFHQLPELIVDDFGGGPVELYNWAGWLKVSAPVGGYVTSDKAVVLFLAKQFLEAKRVNENFVRGLELDLAAMPPGEVRFFVEVI